MAMHVQMALVSYFNNIHCIFTLQHWPAHVKVEVLVIPGARSRYTAHILGFDESAYSHKLGDHCYCTCTRMVGRLRNRFLDNRNM